MARKVDVRKAISQELGVDKAKEFDNLYSTIKQSSGDIVLIESGHNILELEDMDHDSELIVMSGWIGFRCDDPPMLIAVMRGWVKQLQEKAVSHRKKYPSMYSRTPYPNSHLLA